MTLPKPGWRAGGSGGNPTRFPTGTLVGDRQALLPEPAHGLVPARAVVPGQ
jgi:hypothetical protein